MNTKQEIISKLTPFEQDNWGYAANRIQDIAEKVLSKKEFRSYLIESNKDMEECDGMDGQLFNGQYFDWKVFETQSQNIINAFLDYFSENQLAKILGAM